MILQFLLKRAPILLLVFSLMATTQAGVAKEKKEAGSSEPSGKHSIRFKLGYHTFDSNPIPNGFQTDFFTVTPPDPFGIIPSTTLPGDKLFRKSDFNGSSGEAEYDWRFNPGFSLGGQFGIYNLGNTRVSGKVSGTFDRPFTTSTSFSSSSSTPFTTSSSSSFTSNSGPSFTQQNTSSSTTNGQIDSSTALTLATSRDDVFKRDLAGSAEQRVIYITFSPKAHLVDILRGTAKGGELSRIDVYAGPVVGFYRGNATIDGAIAISDAFTGSVKLNRLDNNATTASTNATSTFSQTCSFCFFTSFNQTTNTTINSSSSSQTNTKSLTNFSGSAQFPGLQVRLVERGNTIGLGGLIGVEFRLTKHFSFLIEDRYVHARKLQTSDVLGTRTIAGNFSSSQTNKTQTTVDSSSSNDSKRQDTTTTTATTFFGTTFTSTSPSSSQFSNQNSSTTTTPSTSSFSNQAPFNVTQVFFFGSRSLFNWGGNTIQFGLAFRW